MFFFIAIFFHKLLGIYNTQWNSFILSGTVIEPEENKEHAPSCFIVNYKQIMKDSSKRIDAWYWDPNKNNLAKEIEESVGEEVIEIVRLGDLVVEHGIFYPGIKWSKTG